MITIKNQNDIAAMRIAGRITKQALNLVGQHVRPGITTKELDKIAYDYIRSQGAVPSFLNYNGFPASICASRNDEVVHGIPSKKTVLQDGDIISIDVGAYKGGFHGDCAKTFFVGQVSEEAQKLVAATRQSFYEGMKYAKAGNRIGDISSAIQSYIESMGYSIVRDLVGHGIGSHMHEDPSVPNFGRPGRGPRLVPGMALAIEPMVNAGNFEVRVMDDDWTVKTLDGSLSAHYENTILITGGEPEILTVADE
ncbi:type I methionyl aminopeptidase [Acetivibrio sp. MSJd-27]|mgnify:CR=1 FL=1|uniref:type I methionyl aminopeptidase n=1 Tax=Acetivibrio sp. MSJd-27 TaxID=2841523 RepID=UPI001C11A058|nr:type I methionyl aminopeptidase [Acetivibrio sp. MSJd-27]MBU5449640.1 type I methionyl aminopeptidase [Acetivibrio sp. MSJd-27]